jgi:hypothetical protein
MTKFIFENYTLQELKDICKKLSINSGKTKKECIKDIIIALEKYEKYKDKYKKVKELGFGKQGKTYLVTDKKGHEYAMKTFKKTKSTKKIHNEITLQMKLKNKKICPEIIDYDLDEKYIVMEKMDGELLDIIKKEGLNISRQKRILEIFKILDQNKVFHDDANLANYMIKKGEIYIIDFGYAKIIDDKLIKKLETNTPNYKLMTIGFILKLKETGICKTSYQFLLSAVSKSDKRNFNLN